MTSPTESTRRRACRVVSRTCIGVAAALTPGCAAVGELLDVTPDAGTDLTSSERRDVAQSSNPTIEPPPRGGALPDEMLDFAAESSLVVVAALVLAGLVHASRRRPALTLVSLGVVASAVTLWILSRPELG